MTIRQGTKQKQILWMSLIVLAIGVLAYVRPIGAQNSSAECYHRLNGQYVAVGQQGTAECALSIYNEAEVVNNFAQGGWGSYYLAVGEEGDVFYSRNARRWRFWDTIDVQTQVEPEVEVPTVEPTPTVPSSSADSGDDDQDGIINANDQCQGERENYNNVFDTDGCPDTIQTLLNWAATDLNEFWSAEFSEADIAYFEPRRVSAYRSGGRGSAAYNAYYSRGSHSIAYDLNLMEDVLQRQGDLAPVYILAHEWGHLVQGNLNRFAGRYTFYTEQEADCLAGVYVRNLDDRGLLEEGDFNEGLRQAWAVGDNLPETHPGAHGSPRERATAFTLGFEQGTDACFSEYE